MLAFRICVPLTVTGAPARVGAGSVDLGGLGGRGARALLRGGAFPQVDGHGVADARATAFSNSATSWPLW